MCDEDSSNTHPGQGTANRQFFFNNAYLELLWRGSGAKGIEGGKGFSEAMIRAPYRSNTSSGSSSDPCRD
jgi:hypothetical protein